LDVVVAPLLAQLNPQRAVGRVHGRENAHAVTLEALLHLAQGGVGALGRLKLYAGPAQADLLEEKQLIVAGGGWHAVGQLDVPRVVFVEDRPAWLGRRVRGAQGGSPLKRTEGACGQGCLEKAPSALAGASGRVGIGSHRNVLSGGW